MRTTEKNQNEQITAIQEQDFQAILDTSRNLLDLVDEINLPNVMEELNQAIFGLTQELKDRASKGDSNAFNTVGGLSKIETYSNLMSFVVKVHDHISVLDRQIQHIENRKEATNESK